MLFKKLIYKKTIIRLNIIILNIMATELRAFFEIFFNTINEINENKTNTLLRNSELGITRMLYSDILMEILKELNNNQETRNEGCHFQNNIVNGFHSAQNSPTMTQYLTNSINMIMGFSSKSKEIISDYLDIVLSDSFKKNNSNSRTRLYFRKIQSEIFSRWKKATNNDYDEDIMEFNTLIGKYQVNYSNYIDLFQISSLLYNKDDNILLEIIPFYEKLLKKYEKYDKLKKKLNAKKEESKKEEPKKEETKKEDNKKSVKKPKEMLVEDVEKEDMVVGALTEETTVQKEKKVKKTKEKIPASVKNTLWSLYFPNTLQGNCQCCKTEVISKNNFDCGHIISEKEGGEVKLDNLKPVCRSCNSSMSTMNMNDFMKKYGFDKISNNIVDSNDKKEYLYKEDTEDEEKPAPKKKSTKSNSKII